MYGKKRGKKLYGRLFAGADVGRGAGKILCRLQPNGIIKLSIHGDAKYDCEIGSIEESEAKIGLEP